MSESDSTRPAPGPDRSSSPDSGDVSAPSGAELDDPALLPPPAAPPSSEHPAPPAPYAKEPRRSGFKKGFGAGLGAAPGGTIPGARAIAQAAERYRDRTGHPVIAYVTGMAASGGMYAMAGADHIYADQGTMIGSIGVIMGPFAHYSGVTQIDNGILSGGVSADSIEQFYLTQGTGKDFGNAFREMTDEERAVYTSDIAREYDVFVQWVADERGISTETIRNELGAYLYDAQTAVDKNLADAVMGRDEAFRQAATDSGVDPGDTRIIADTTPGALSRLFGADSSRIFGHGAPMTNGTATSELCTSATTVFAWSANPVQACGS